MNGAVIEIEGLGKSYGSFTAVRDLSLSIRRGEVFGFLGPNGAGKTTAIRMLMGILVPSAGTARIEGLDCQRQCRDREPAALHGPSPASVLRSASSAGSSPAAVNRGSKPRSRG